MISSHDQLAILAALPHSFEETIRPHLPAASALAPCALSTLQLNIGKRCNQSCRHCHVGASPLRTETMSREIMDDCLQVIAATDEIKTVDITGGAPEMNDNFSYLIQACKNLGKHVIDRCNLTILEEPGYGHLGAFLAEQGVEIMASLPYFRKSYTDRQRGAGVFEKSIRALQKLNRLGYGTELPLNLIYNPSGIYLSSSQALLESEFRNNLKEAYGIDFNHLYCINNLPLDGFLQALLKLDKLTPYMDMLKTAFNPCTLDGLMCRYQLSVSYDGYLYDCDFNQMLDLKIMPAPHIREFSLDRIMSRKIRTMNHCFGCTAGSGSSCGGELVLKKGVLT
ncbi:MAG: arsenosugar biosynthesis radical SAM protein ArsS [Proteobacteria bacterium]|nr:arsenosugar biosynthesis radical SAM protein ArsS [Pseudomonadota bacterium]MBU1568946.1 arsenosugar biosynthesis radical SAM protein ArsS [Pseudomonadota bacterium]